MTVYTKAVLGLSFTMLLLKRLVGTVKWAVDVWYHDKEGFETLQQNAMQKRFDWAEAAHGYEDLYRYIMQGRRSHLEQGA